MVIRTATIILYLYYQFGRRKRDVGNKMMRTYAVTDTKLIPVTPANVLGAVRRKQTIEIMRDHITLQTAPEDIESRAIPPLKL